MSTPEEKARGIIDQKLTAAGWAVQDFKQLNLGAGPGVAVREFVTASGPADYVLFVDREAVGIVEAKKAGTTLSGVFEQSARYMSCFPAEIPHVELPLPFSYESTWAGRSEPRMGCSNGSKIIVCQGVSVRRWE